MALYDVIGKTYAQTRKSDPRITEKLLEILASSRASTIADIGAGTGSYALVLAEYGYRVFAIEPSQTMRSQAITHPEIEWIQWICGELAITRSSSGWGMWDCKYGHLRQQSQYDVGYRFVHRPAV